MSLIQRFMRLFFHLLYHSFAFTYDLVAAAVSFGTWKDWVYSILPFIKGTRLLELGHGPGHLQRLLLDRGLVAAAIDESTQMGRIAKRRLGSSHRLTRGLAQSLPYQSGIFDTIIATFPTEYFADPETLSEVRRCLDNGGRFVVLLAAMPKNRFLSWLFKVTEQAPTEALKTVQERLEEPFLEANFHVETHLLDLQSGRLIIIVATPSR